MGNRMLQLKLNLKKFFQGPAHVITDDDARLAVAQLLIEIARADTDTAVIETDAIRGYLRHAYALDESVLDTLMQTAGERVEKAVSLHETIDVLNRTLDAERKSALIRALWQVAYADGHLSPYEVSMLRRLADLLYVPHSSFIREKLAVTDG
jgi:uncharacterized tellurite resistance protein B-like protein